MNFPKPPSNDPYWNRRGFQAQEGTLDYRKSPMLYVDNGTSLAVKRYDRKTKKLRSK